MKKKLVTLLVATGLLVGVAGAGTLATTRSHSQDGSIRMRIRSLLSERGFQPGQFKQKLNLTSSQQEELKAIVQSHKAEIATVIHDLAEHRLALREAMNGSTVDETAIRAATTAMNTTLGDAAVLVAKIKSEARHVLTPEQLEQIAGLRSAADDILNQIIDRTAHP